MAPIIGMGRVICDGGLVFYIQDVIVHPDYQRQGISAKMMDHVTAYIGSHASQNSFNGLIAAQGKEPFYKKHGFIKRSAERLGHGTTMFWQTAQSIKTV